SDNRVSILAESAELSSEIDVQRAEKAAARARQDGSQDDLDRAETRIRVASL
ncbi:MAG: F0F1 ATP synthase subunit epsilon, partial [Actinomycetes bacterium]